MKEQRKQRLKKALWALLLGVGTFLYDYGGVMTLLMQNWHSGCLRLFEQPYWYFSALFPIIIVPIFLNVLADCGPEDWIYFLLIAGVQMLCLPALYAQCVQYYGLGSGIISWIALGWCMLYRIVTVFFLQIIVSLIPLAFGNRW